MVIEFSADAEYNDTVLRALYLAGTVFPVTITHSTTEALSTGVSQFQIGIPALTLKSPVLPPMNDETTVVGISGDVLWDTINEGLYVMVRTASATL
jgi:hypothetical protein